MATSDFKRWTKEETVRAKAWAKHLLATGWTASSGGTRLRAAPSPGLTPAVVTRATDGRLHLFSPVPAGPVATPRAPLSDRVRKKDRPLVLELAARFNKDRFFELLELDVDTGQLVYKVVLLRGFRGEDPSVESVRAALEVHFGRHRAVVDGLRATLAGKPAADVAAELLELLTRYHPIEHGP
jgi:hypothetical protein